MNMFTKKSLMVLVALQFASVATMLPAAGTTTTADHQAKVKELVERLNFNEKIADIQRSLGQAHSTTAAMSTRLTAKALAQQRHAPQSNHHDDEISLTSASSTRSAQRDQGLAQVTPPFIDTATFPQWPRPAQAPVARLSTKQKLAQAIAERDMAITFHDDVATKLRKTQDERDAAQRQNLHLKRIGFVTVVAALTWKPVRDSLRGLYVGTLRGIGNALSSKK